MICEGDLPFYRWHSLVQLRGGVVTVKPAATGNRQ